MSTPGIPYSSSSWDAARQLQLPNHLVRRREFDSGLTPGGRAGGHASLVQASGHILDEAHLTAPLKEAADHCVVTDVGGDAEHDDLVGIEALEQRVGVRVGEDIEALLQQQELAPREVPLRHELERQRDRVLL